MKKAVVLALLVVLCVASVSAQARLDIGIDIPLSLGAVLNGSSVLDGGDIPYTLPFPSGGLYYTFGAGPVTLGLGARLYSLVLVSAMWPNVIAEVDVGPVVLEGQFGGGAFLIFGLVSSTQTGSVFFPDLSAWFKLGKTLRLGGGALGMFIKDLDNTVPFVWYIGAKAAIRFD
ncbi:MAG: hypothetical protein CVV51_04160 [Spirochaetae bacterium HGW-Spirochaetae-7]|nr:MAG: hypothetical protein CVV51_04160 [Spirochaetae bacterium HGW-Spirochaetae-7]